MQTSQNQKLSNVRALSEQDSNASGPLVNAGGSVFWSQPYVHGRNDYLHRIPVVENPYPTGLDHQDWLNGWIITHVESLLATEYRYT